MEAAFEALNAAAEKLAAWHAVRHKAFEEFKSRHVDPSGLGFLGHLREFSADLVDRGRRPRLKTAHATVAARQRPCRPRLKTAHATAAARQRLCRPRPGTAHATVVAPH